MLEAEGIPPVSPDRSASLPVLLSEVKGCKFHPGMREKIDWVRLTVLKQISTNIYTQRLYQ